MEELKVYHAESAGEGIYEEMTELISSDYLEVLKSDGCFFYCAAVEEEGLMGVMAIKEENAALVIRYIYVLPEMRRMGVGSGLLQFLISEIAGTGYRRPVGAWYPDSRESEGIHELFRKQPNFIVRKKTASEIKLYEALWNGMTIAELDLLFDDGSEKEEGYYENLNLPDPSGVDLYDTQRMLKEYAEIKEVKELFFVDEEEA